MLGAVDSLLTSLVADSLTSDYHDSDKELRGALIAATCKTAIDGFVADRFHVSDMKLHYQ